MRGNALFRLNAVNNLISGSEIYNPVDIETSTIDNEQENLQVLSLNRY